MSKKSDNILSFFDFTKKRNFIRDFYDFDAATFEKLLREKGEDFWEEEGRKRALRIFHLAAERIPAYADFLRRHKIRHSTVKTFEDFAALPLTDKENYVQKYPLSMRSWDGELSKTKLTAMSSGTSGEATLWPRGAFQEFEAAAAHELLYRSAFEIHKYSTLLVIGFPMGVYVSGVATLLPSYLVAAKGYPMTIVSVGNNKVELLRVIKNLQKEYEQIVLVGHPLFIKDVVESGAAAGVVWSKKRVRMMFCSEEFSEKWRKYVINEADANSIVQSAISTYGSSELLLMAYETPLSIMVRNFMERQEAFKTGLIGEEPVPNLFQYNPLFRYIESVNNELVFTSASGIPLIRFNMHDTGTVFSFRKAKEALGEIDYAKHKEFSDIDEKSFWQLPFVALWGRSDYKIVFYAANIYPEHIRPALSQSALFPKLTGKFVLRKDYLKNMDAFLEINVELRKDIKPSHQLASKIRGYVVEHLQKVNMEYLFIYNNNPDKDLRPRVKLWPYQHEKYFKPGLKPRYIAND